MENRDLMKKEDILPLAKFNSKDFSKDKCVAFTGSPLKHPFDGSKFVLISDPLSDQTQFFEFSKNNVASIDELSALSSDQGESIRMVRVWIYEGVAALRYHPFIVGRTGDIVDKFKNQ